MPLQTYRQLEVWQVAMELVEAIYSLTAIWDRDERFGLTSQARRAAVSIPANIAEGYGRMTRRDYLRFLSISRGSVMELQVHLNVAVRVGLCTRESIRSAWKLSTSVVKMLTSQIKALMRSDASVRPQAPGPKTPRSSTQGANS